MIGTTVGSYRIVSQLGAGGMGVVYKAFDERLHRHVAFKVLPLAVSADEGRRRLFLREARAASALNDAHIIAIYDIFEHEGRDVLVMELVEGRTLRDAIAGGQVAVSQAIDWTRQMAEALGVAHGAGIVHRDLKPGNVMITVRGALKVLDFGLAKVPVTGDEATLAPETKSGDVLGTVEYMSPEQARGKPVDHRTDIYALGTILYEMLMGRRPFVAENQLALLRGDRARHSSPSAIAAAGGERSARRCGEPCAGSRSADALPVDVGVRRCAEIRVRSRQRGSGLFSRCRIACFRPSVGACVRRTTRAAPLAEHRGDRNRSSRAVRDNRDRRALVACG